MAGRDEQDQSEAIAFLADPANHGGASVERFDTHGALVFVADDRAYKIKRAVRYTYLDFSTLARRRAVCLKELAINRESAPEIYLGVRPLLRDAEGGLAFGSEADGDDKDALEWVLVMRAFDQDDLFEKLAARGDLNEALTLALAVEIAARHDAAPPLAPGAPHRGGCAGLAETIAENAEDFAARPDLFPEAELRRLQAGYEAQLARWGDLLDRRLAAGLVRHCHGDLHLRNICLVEGRPRLFDAIEFNDAIATIDLLYDLAFLLMDLDRRGLTAQANLLFNRYVQERDEEAALGLLPLFLSVRAAIRAKVAAVTEAAHEDPAARARDRGQARDYFAAAQAYLEPPPACLIAFGGLSGSGKSSVARALAPAIGAAPGALLLRSDQLRKRAFGVAETEALPAEAYTKSASDRVYEAMAERAETALRAGHSVVLDAVHARPAERAAAAALAAQLGVPFRGFWLEASPETLFARTAGRKGDASDATPEVVRQQLDYDLGPLDWDQISAEGTPEEVRAAARRALASGLPQALRPSVDSPE